MPQAAMKLTAEYKNGVLVLEKPISPKNSTVRIKISDDDLNSPVSESPVMIAFLDEEERKIKELMAKDPFYANLWRGMPTRPARAGGQSARRSLRSNASPVVLRIWPTLPRLKQCKSCLHPMTKEELYAHPGWEWCTFEGARKQIHLIGLETTFREKLQWLEEAETLALQLRGRDSGSRESKGNPEI